MLFPFHTETTLRMMAVLVNSGRGAADALTEVADLQEFFRHHKFSGTPPRTVADLEAVRATRDELATVFDAPVEHAVGLVNSVLLRTRALPQLVNHGDWGWHLHALTGHAPLADRIAVDAALALVEVIRDEELDRLKVCAAADCTAVLVDFSRNRSKRFCDTGNCANRTHVAAYRKRRGTNGIESSHLAGPD